MIGHSLFFPFISVLFFLTKNACSSGLGKCPRFDYMNNFNITRFSGKWHEIERTFYLIELLSSCVTVDMKIVTNSKVQISVASKTRWSDDVTFSEGFAIQGKRDPSILVYKVNSKLPTLVSKYLPGAGQYQVLDTDYEHYAVLWSCTDYFFVHTDMIWIWGRKPDLNVTTRARIYNYLEQKELDSDRLILPKNADC